MLTLASSEIMSWIGSFLWPLFRIAALVTAAPVFGARTITTRIKLVFAIGLTLVIMPVIPPLPSVDPISGAAVIITLNQIIIGAAMGLALQMLFGMFVAAGQIIAFQMGLGFASMIDPSSGTSVPVVSQLYVVLLTLLFLALNGHLLMIEVLANSFQTMPIGLNALSSEGIWALVSWGSTLYAGAVQIALPAIASLLLFNLTFGIVTRSAPQFNIFAIGFPVTMVAGFFIMLTTLPSMMPHIERKLGLIFELMRDLTSNVF